VLELGGVRDVLTKSIGTQNPINLVKATMDGLVRLRRPEEVAELRGLTVTQVLGMDGNGAAKAAGPVSDTASSPGGEDPASSPPAAEAAPADEQAAAPVASDEQAEAKAAEGAEAEKQESGS
jgi:small subunit ribosomal protein S5